MHRLLLALLALSLAAPAAAQTNPPAVERATHALGALWRPLEGPISEASITTTCAGAVEEMNAVAAALPADLSPANLARVRPEHGLLIVPADAAGFAYFFPPASLSWFSPGLGAVTVLDEAQGLIGAQDAEGHTFVLQLGHAGQRAVLRVRPPQGALATYVGCAQAS